MNKNTFNPVRFMHCLRKDWTENGIRHLFHFLIAYVLLTALFLFIDYGRTVYVTQSLDDERQGIAVKTDNYKVLLTLAAEGHESLNTPISATTATVFALFLAYTGSRFFRASKLRQNLITDLTLPVSASEKFAMCWLQATFISSLLFALAAMLADFTRIELIHHIFPNTDLAYPVEWFNYSYLPNELLQAYAVQALFILGTTYWRNNPFQTTFCVLMLLGTFYYGLFIWNMFAIVKEANLKNFDWQAFYGHLGIGLNVFLLVFGYVMSYLRIRRVSLIVSWKDRTSLALLAVAVAGLILCCWIPCDTAARLTAQ